MRTKAEYDERNYFHRRPCLDDSGLSERLYELGRLISRKRFRAKRAGEVTDDHGK